MPGTIPGSRSGGGVVIMPGKSGKAVGAGTFGGSTLARVLTYAAFSASAYQGMRTRIFAACFRAASARWWKTPASSSARWALAETSLAVASLLALAAGASTAIGLGFILR